MKGGASVKKEERGWKEREGERKEGIILPI